ncbi:pheromone-regulated membrane protein, putative [Paecilomyces variotii No. 5]|uniref:Pheromone-regulated membrane protein, putative n=1 Tax=Byssochlamys spectabilis (strain No. 5 / NBRC 109023) TaxID=1356009 RepID=V5FY97_BYSSN|nr:pheromone-regulated membrane protein, putative [Paecilomyces variotii No. 5]
MSEEYTEKELQKELPRSLSTLSSRTAGSPQQETNDGSTQELDHEPRHESNQHETAHPPTHIDLGGVAQPPTHIDLGPAQPPTHINIEETHPPTHIDLEAAHPPHIDLDRAETARDDQQSESKQHGHVPSRVASGIDKARHILSKLGRPEDQGDALIPAATAAEFVKDGDNTPPNAAGAKTKESGRKLRFDPSLEAHQLVRGFSGRERLRRRFKPQQTPIASGDTTPVGSDTESEYSRGVHAGILSQLLKLQARQQKHDTSQPPSPNIRTPSEFPDGGDYFTPPSGVSTGHNTPKREKIKWYKKENSRSAVSLIEAGLHLGASAAPHHSTEGRAATAKYRGHRRSASRPRMDDEARIAIYIAQIITRQKYLIKLCRCLMKFGAPSHRLEEYMQMTAKALDLSAQFLYLPNFMIMSFDDTSTRTTEVKMVRVAQGVDLARLDDTQDVYKNVIHDKISVEEAIAHLEEIMTRPARYPTWIVVLVYGLASVAVGPFAFEARPIDMPIIFILGCLLGLMKLVFAPRSSLYTNVFEVFASVITSFLSRAFGSIRYGMIDGKQQYLFCFSSMAQSSIALILPGFLVLSSSLELQSHQIIAGSIRMVYSIIYSLFLGYGITVGTTIYGLMDPNANPYTTCSGPPIGNEYVQRFPFVALYVVFLSIINQGKWKDLPIMILVAVAGYVVSYFSNKKLDSNPELSNTLSALAVGILGNLYSRIWHGHAATAIMPAIFVLVPSGLASSGSLVAGVQSAAELRSNITGNSSELSNVSNNSDNSTVWDIGYGMIQVAVGITVGLFLAALVVYPTGKRRSGLFSF